MTRGPSHQGPGSVSTQSVVPPDNLDPMTQSERAPQRLDPRLIGGVAVALLILAGGLVFALSRGEDDEPVTTTTTRPVTTTTEEVTTTSEPATGPIAPLTGLHVADPALVNRPALAAKIDNLDTGRESALPQAGLNRTDLVFEEVVEGNITRLVGVFHSKAPGRIELQSHGVRGERRRKSSAGSGNGRRSARRPAATGRCR